MAITTPVFLHKPLAEVAVERGMNVFVEKPLALNGDEGRRLWADGALVSKDDRENNSTEDLLHFLLGPYYGTFATCRHGSDPTISLVKGILAQFINTIL